MRHHRITTSDGVDLNVLEVEDGQHFMFVENATKFNRILVDFMG